MPFTNKWTETGIEKFATGKVTAKEIILSNCEMYGDERFDTLKYGLADFTQAESFEMVKKDGSSALVSFNGKIGRDEKGEFKQTH